MDKPLGNQGRGHCTCIGNIENSITSRFKEKLWCNKELKDKRIFFSHRKNNYIPVEKYKCTKTDRPSLLTSLQYKTYLEE